MPFMRLARFVWERVLDPRQGLLDPRKGGLPLPHNGYLKALQVSGGLGLHAMAGRARI